MKLHNKSKHPYQHSYLDDKNNLQSIVLNVGEVKEIPDNIAKIWIKMGEIVEFVAPEDAKATEKALLAQIEALKAENQKLKATKNKEVKIKGKK